MTCKHLSKVEELILGKLEECAREGFSTTAIEAAINSNEFSLRENNTGSFPRGLSLMLRASAAWIYDRDPIRPLQWTKDLEHFKVIQTHILMQLGGTKYLAVSHPCYLCGTTGLEQGPIFQDFQV